MESTNSLLLNRVFTRNTFQHLLNDGESPAFSAAIRRYVADSTGKTNGECISTIYQQLKQNYQNEYYYKNTLLNKLLLGIHSLYTTAALTEVPVANSKADFILINGEAVVYEIKTALDNFERLDGQVADYYKAFTRVMVVTAECNVGKITQRLSNSPVGICILTSKGTLSIRKEPEEYREQLSKETMFKTLRKDEYERIIIQQFGQLPSVSQFEHYRVCQRLFESIPTMEAYALFLKALKSRTRIDIDEYTQVPYELKFLVYFSGYKSREYASLRKFLLEEE